MQPKLTDKKGEICKLTIIDGDFKTSVSVSDQQAENQE